MLLFRSAECGIVDLCRVDKLLQDDLDRALNGVAELIYDMAIGGTNIIQNWLNRSGALFFDADGVGGVAQMRLAQ